MGTCSGFKVQQKGLGGGSRVGKGEVSGSRGPGRASQATAMIPNFIINEMGSHWTLLRKDLTYNFKSLAISQKRLQGRKV